MQKTPLNMMEILEQKSSSNSHIDTVIDLIRQQNAELESANSVNSDQEGEDHDDQRNKEEAPRGEHEEEAEQSEKSESKSKSAAGGGDKEEDIEEKKKQELIKRHTKGVIKIDTRDYNDPEAFKIIKKEKFQGKTALAQHKEQYETSRKYQKWLKSQPISFDYIDEIKEKLKT